MVVEPERLAAVDAQRLERAAAAHERLVVDVHDRLVGVDEPAAAHGECENHVRTA
jgi:hypothetical protein